MKDRERSREERNRKREIDMERGGIKRKREL